MLGGGTDPSCIDCTASQCPAPPGFETQPRWTKPGLYQNCQNCNENPYRFVDWYDDGGGCFDTTNRCYWLRQRDVSCPTAGNPPQQWFCYDYQLLECQIGNCVDADGDGYPVASSECHLGPFDCDDTNAAIHPNGTEDCYDPMRKDEDCDTLHNCEDIGSCGTPSPGGPCDEQCDQDDDGFYSMPCGGQDCADNCAECTPHEFGENGGSAPYACDDGLDNDSDCDIDCDDDDCSQVEPCVNPTPTPPPAPTPTPGGCNAPPDYIAYPGSGCASGFVLSGGVCTRSAAYMSNCFRFGGYDFDSCSCEGWCDPGAGCSPIVVDVLGNGFDLTAARNGVSFDIDNDGDPELIAWTKSSADDAWLSLDRNLNGLIDGGKELFGNVTPQPPPAEGQEMHGFLALALYDNFAYGGNGDGFITKHDSIFDRLKLWQDSNHNGISEVNELFSLPQLGLRKIDLDYRLSSRVDAHGNQFKYRSRVRDSQDAQLGRWAWDVFLVVDQP